MVWDKNERIHQSQIYLGAKHVRKYILLKKLSKKKKKMEKEKEETACALYTQAFVELKLLKISAYAF